MKHNDAWPWTRRTFIKSSLVAALLAGYKLLIPSVARADSTSTTAQRSGPEVAYDAGTDPFGVTGLEKKVVRKSYLGYELCPGPSAPDS
jgi:hypothetical protein